MNKPNNLSNSFTPCIAPETAPAYAFGLCCINISQKSFFIFVSIFDLLSLPLFIIFADTFTKINSGLLLLFSIINIISYLVSKDYGSVAQKIYAIVRIVSTLCGFILILSVFILLIFFIIMDEMKELTIKETVFILVELGCSLPFFLVSAQWSFLLRVIVKNKSSARDSQKKSDAVKETLEYSYETYKGGKVSDFTSG